jgi:hypothetical protein
VCLILNAITFLLAVLEGERVNQRGVLSFNKLFDATIILTVLSIMRFGLSESWKLVKEFHAKNQRVLMAGQILISVFIAAVGYLIVSNLIKFMFNL